MEKLNQRFPSVVEDIKRLDNLSIRATKEEALAGTDSVKIITPKTLKEYIEVNGGGTGSGGTVINNVVRSGSINGKYTATADNVYTFTIPDMNKTKEVMLITSNLILIDGEQYRIDKKTGLVTLEYALMKGDTIHYQVISTSYKMEDLDGGTTVPARIIEGNSNTIEVVNRIASPVSVEEIQGRTLVNLLGRSGNAIYKQAQNYVNFTPIFEEDHVKILTDSGKWSMFNYDNLQAGKSYICLCEFKSNHPDTGKIQIGDLNINDYKGSWWTQGNNYQTIWSAVTLPPNSGNISAHFQFGCGNSSQSYVKNLRVYEISREIYDKIKVDPEYTGDKLIEKFPYVDDIKCVVNPYIENKENLLDNIIVEEGWVGNGQFTPGKSDVVYVTNLSKNLPSGKYTFHIENLPQNYTVTGLNSTHSKYYTITHTQGTMGELYRSICITEGQTGSTEEVISKINSGEWKVTLVKGDKPKTYEECHNSRIMFETLVYEGEKITRDNMGRYVKNSEWGEVILNNNSWWYLHVNQTHHKVAFNYGDIGLILSNDLNLVYYDGSVQTIPSTDNGKWYPDGETLDLVASLPNSLTGWGPSYIPTIEEIKAYFLGWRMCRYEDGDQYNNSADKKAWVKLWCGIGDNETYTPNLYNTIPGTMIDTCPTTINDQGYTPYKLIYKKATPTQEIVKTHGALSIDANSTLTVSSGLVLGEHASKANYAKSNYYINGDLKGSRKLDAKLKFRANKVLKLLKGFELCDYIPLRFSPESTIIFGNLVVKHFSLPHTDEYYIDYLIYKPDTVISYPYKLAIQENIASVQDKLVEELSNTNLKLTEENIKLRNELEPFKNLSNPNLLINGDFQVWQRGEVIENLTQLYGADRWTSTARPLKWIKTNYGVRVENMDVTINPQNQIFIRQRFTNDMLTKYVGKTLTLSAKIKYAKFGFIEAKCRPSGYVISSTPGRELSNEIISTTFNLNYDMINDKYVEFSFIAHNRIPNDASTGLPYIEVEWVKLEVGDKATPYIYKSYSEELTLCRRYYEKNILIANYINGVVGNQCVFNYIHSKRVVPSVVISVDGKPDIINFLGTNLGIVNKQPGHNEVRFTVPTTAGGAPGQLAIITADVVIDAEIY